MSDITMPGYAMLFAAGLGTRMRPRTNHTPKPLIEVNGKALMDYGLALLDEAGVENVVVNTHHLSEQIEQHVRTINRPKLHLIYEPVLLETGGGLVNAQAHLGDEFFVLNSDTITLPRVENPLMRMAEAWQPEVMDALLLLQPRAAAFGYDGGGDFDLADDNQPAQLLRMEMPPRGYVYTGIMLMKAKLLAGLKAEPFSLNQILFNRVADDGSMRGVYGLVHDGKWLHIGTEAAIAEAEMELT